MSLLYLSCILSGIGLFGVLKLLRLRHAPHQRFAAMQQERQHVLQHIAHIDDEYARGKLPQAAYQAERAELKHQLIELTGQCKTQS